MNVIKLIITSIILSIIFSYISLGLLSAVYPNNAVLICLVVSVLVGFGSSGYCVSQYKGSDNGNT